MLRLVDKLEIPTWYAGCCISLSPQLFITDHSKAVVLLWFSVACFGVRVLVTLHIMCAHIVFSSVWVAEWPSFEKELLTWLTICSLCILTICNFSYFRLVLRAGFGF